MDNNNTYKVFVFCSNCRFRDEIEIPKRTLINETSCPKCGNMTIRDDPNGEMLKKPHIPASYR